MIAFLLAAAILPDPTFKPAAPTPVMAKAEQSRSAAVSPLPSAVAVTVECTARADGRIEDCSILGETQPGLGFGETAIALVEQDRVDPSPRDVRFARTIQFTP